VHSFGLGAKASNTSTDGREFRFPRPKAPPKRNETIGQSTLSARYSPRAKQGAQHGQSTMPPMNAFNQYAQTPVAADARRRIPPRTPRVLYRISKRLFMFNYPQLPLPRFCRRARRICRNRAPFVGINRDKPDYSGIRKLFFCSSTSQPRRRVEFLMDSPSTSISIAFGKSFKYVVTGFPFYRWN